MKNSKSIVLTKRLYMKHVLFVLILLFSNGYLHGQSYIAPQSYTIFYPVNFTVKEQISGFDCFYETNKAHKNKKYVFSMKNRFMPNEQKLTPYKEIEEHKFNIINTEHYIYKKRKYYVVNFNREDGQKITMAIPFFPNEQDNLLTKNMVSIDVFGYSTVKVPCIGEDTYERLRNFENKEISMVNYVTDVPWTVFDTMTRGDFLHVIGIRWSDSTNTPYPILIAICQDHKKETVILPLYLNLSNGKTFVLDDYFKTKNQLINQHLNEKTKELINQFLHKNVYYGLKHGRSDAPGEFSFLNPKDLSDVKLNEGYYKCCDIDIVYKDNWQLVFKLLDEKGDSTLAKLLNYSTVYDPRKEKQFDNFFVTEEYAKKYFEEQRIKEEEDSKLYSLWKKKYGKAVADYFKDYAEGRDKFLLYAKKWGSSVAFDICRGYVRIGWNKEKCRLAWGEPEDINKTIGVWGVHEQWCYNGSYLYFENGILSSIQN